MFQIMKLVAKQELQINQKMDLILRAKINTFASIFPTSNPQYVFIVMLDTPKNQKIIIINIDIKKVAGREPYIIQQDGHQ